MSTTRFHWSLNVSMPSRDRPSSASSSSDSRDSWYQRASIAAATRLCATEMAWMSPVRWRLNSSIGTTWLYPPPAAPPLMPKVGPIDGWRMAAIAFFPIWPSPWVSPTVVVVFPSPSGVGVMAVTSMYLPRGFSPIRWSASRWTLAFDGPYEITSSGRSPICSASSLMGRVDAARAMSMSLGMDMGRAPLIERRRDTTADRFARRDESASRNQRLRREGGRSLPIACRGQ